MSTFLTSHKELNFFDKSYTAQEARFKFEDSSSNLNIYIDYKFERLEEGSAHNYKENLFAQNFILIRFCDIVTDIHLFEIKFSLSQNSGKYYVIMAPRLRFYLDNEILKSLTDRLADPNFKLCEYIDLYALPKDIEKNWRKLQTRDSVASIAQIMNANWISHEQKTYLVDYISEPTVSEFLIMKKNLLMKRFFVQKELDIAELM